MHAYPEFILAMNEKSFQKLSKEQQKIITDASNEVRDELRKNAKTEDAAALAKLKEKGMEVYVVPASEVGIWQAATKPCWDIFIQHVSNMRASGSDDSVHLIPPRTFSLEQALEQINDDELVEVTPKSIRMRKTILDRVERGRQRSRSKKD